MHDSAPQMLEDKDRAAGCSRQCVGKASQGRTLEIIAAEQAVPRTGFVLPVGGIRIRTAISIAHFFKREWALETLIGGIKYGILIIRAFQGQVKEIFGAFRKAMEFRRNKA